MIELIAAAVSGAVVGGDAEAVIAAADDDFKIATYRGVHVKRDYKVIQAGRNPTV